MGIYYNAYVIIGIYTDRIIDSQSKTTEHEEHDRFGNKTGSMFSHTITTFTVKGRKEIFENYVDTLNFLEDITGYKCESIPEDYGCVLGRIIFKNTSRNQDVLESRNLEKIMKIKEKVEKNIFQTLGIHMKARLYFLGYNA